MTLKQPIRAQRRKSLPGGPAALRGFLYQFFSSADWVTGLMLRPGVRQVTLASVTLEPTGGGDVIHSSGSRSRTIQFKSAARPLALTAIVDKVFPDLFQAVMPGAIEQELVLQSDLPVGRLGGLPALIELLKKHPTDEALRQAKRAGLQFRLRKSKPCDAPKFFQRAGATASKQQSKIFKADIQARERFADLLRRFVIDPPLTDDQMQERVLARLAEVALDPAEAPSLLSQLIGELTLRASKGHHQVDAARLLEVVSLSPLTLGGLASWTRNLSETLERQLSLAGYEADKDCRESPPYAPGEAPVVFCGPSGVGKTWIMARAARAALDDGDRVIWLEGPHIPGAIRERVTDALQAARSISARKTNSDALGPLLDRLGLLAGPIRVTVCLDRFGSFEEARQIINDSWWLQQGIRLLAAFPASDPSAVELAKATVVETPNFTPFEVRLLFRHRPRAWTTLPSDIRTLLERPFLASLYEELSRDDGIYTPHTEYELIDQAWRAPPRRGGHLGTWRHARSVLADKIDRFIDDLLVAKPAVYPWPLNAAPILTEEQVLLLEERGLLRWSGPDAVRLDHDRFLAWGLAEALVQRHRQGHLTDDQLKHVLEACMANDNTVLPGRALGYVAMDVFWRLLDPNVAPRAGLIVVARALSGHGDRKIDWPVWATLGSSVLPLFLAIAEGGDGDSGRAIPPTRLGKAIASVGQPRLSRTDQGRIGVLLASTDAWRRSVALAAIAALPDLAHLPTLLEMAGVLFAQPSGVEFRSWRNQREAVSTALAAVANAWPDGFLEVSANLTDSRQAAAAAWIAAELPPIIARSAWLHLRGLVADEDRLKLDRLYAGLVGGLSEAAVAADAVAGSTSFCRLSEVRPEHAIFLFQSFEVSFLGQVICELSGVRAGLQPAEAKIVELLDQGLLIPEAVAHSIGPWSSRLGGDLIDAIVESIDDLDDAPKRLSLLTDAPSVEVLQQLEVHEARAFGAKLEMHLLDGGTPKGELRSFARLLPRLGAAVLSRVAAAQLLDPEPRIARSGLAHALVGDEREFLPALVTLAERAIEADESFASPDPLAVLAAIDSESASQLASARLRQGGELLPVIAANTALLTDNSGLAEEAYAALDLTRKDDLIHAALIGSRFGHSTRDRVAIADMLLELGESDARAQAAWVAAELNDTALAARVERALVPGIFKSVDSSDQQALTFLLEMEETGARLMALFDRPENGFLRHVLMDLEVPRVMAHPLAQANAVRSAFELEAVYLGTPRGGLRQLWQIHSDVAFEAFEEGLRRGGRTMEGMITAAVQADADRAFAVMLGHWVAIGTQKLRDDVGRGLRAHPNRAALIPSLADRLSSLYGGDAIAAAELSGWLSLPALDAELQRVVARTSHSKLAEAARSALARSDRIRFLEDLNRRLSDSTAPLEQRRLLAISLTANQDKIVSRQHDPLSIGPFLHVARHGLLLDAWSPKKDR